MTREEIFDLWAPRHSTWTPWAKPVLFAHMPPVVEELRTGESVFQYDISWVGALEKGSAIVADLPGLVCVKFGLNAAAEGFRPVPLFNAAPGPEGFITQPAFWSAGASVPIALVDVRPVLGALSSGAAALRTMPLPDNAPPAFLLDSTRHTFTGERFAGRFDNRSYSFPSDFPSAEFLKRNSIRKVVLVQIDETVIKTDLESTLLSWQKAGISISIKWVGLSAEPKPITIRPSYLRWLWYRFMATFDLYKSPLGGFGGTIPASGG